MKQHKRISNKYGCRMPRAYSHSHPQRLYLWIETLFADYRNAHKDRPTLTRHMFRKRAFTMAWEAGVDPRRASIAYGCSVDTLMRHYVSLDEHQVTDDVFGQVHGKKS